MSEHDVDTHTFGVDCWRGPVQPMARAHRHDDIEINVADIDLEYLIDGRPHVLSAGAVAMFWAARPHRLLSVAEGGRQAWLTVPLARALSWGVPQEIIGTLLRGAVLFAPRNAAGRDPGDSMARWRDELRSDGATPAAPRSIALLEIEAAVLRWVLAAPVAAVPAEEYPSRDRSGRAGAMIAFVSAHSAEDITAADVAAHVHLHPQYAMGLFRRAAGITMGEYLAQCRVAHAQALLLSTDRSIADIATMAGFGSQSQFYDRFGRLCGQSPAAYRRRLREAVDRDGRGAGTFTPTDAR
jgi:AraC-like DNA-binding protein